MIFNVKIGIIAQNSLTKGLKSKRNRPTGIIIMRYTMKKQLLVIEAFSGILFVIRFSAI